MLKLIWYEGLDVTSKKKNWYVRKEPKQTLGIRDMAKHMEEHHTPFTAGTIEGLLTDFVKCIREQLLDGNSVKIDDLAIFKLSVESNPYDSPGGSVDTVTGQFEAVPCVGSAVRSVKMQATATGDLVRARLNKDVKMGWGTEAKAMMKERLDEARAEAAREVAAGEAAVESAAESDVQP